MVQMAVTAQAEDVRISVEAARQAIAVQVCPFCGKGPYRVLAAHTSHQHGIKTEQLHDLARIPYSKSICSPEVSAQKSAVSKEKWPTGGRPWTPAHAKPRRSEAKKDIDEQRVVHGRKRYDKGCRCEMCRAALAAHMRHMRQLHPKPCLKCGRAVPKPEFRRGAKWCSACAEVRSRELLRLHAAGLSSQKIAERLGTSRSQIRRELAKIGELQNVHAAGFAAAETNKESP